MQELDSAQMMYGLLVNIKEHVASASHSEVFRRAKYIARNILHKINAEPRHDYNCDAMDDTQNSKKILFSDERTYGPQTQNRSSAADVNEEKKMNDLLVHHDGKSL